LFAVIDIIRFYPDIHFSERKVSQYLFIVCYTDFRHLPDRIPDWWRAVSKVLNLYVHSFAAGGSIVMFLIELEMVLGMEISTEFS